MGLPGSFPLDNEGSSFMGESYFSGLDDENSKTMRDIESQSKFGSSMEFKSVDTKHNGQNSIIEVPNARLGKEVPLSSTSLLGTSQLSGCQGDFCHVRLDLLEDPNVAGGRNANNSLSKFRRRLMEADTSQFGSASTHTSDFDSSYADIDNNTATNIILGELSSADLKKTSELRKRTDSESENLFHIPLRSIIQARQEMPFVKSLLLRRKNKESGDYFSVDDYHDIATSGKLPAVYYSDVPCCLNCSKVLTIYFLLSKLFLRRCIKLLIVPGPKLFKKSPKNEIKIKLKILF